ncbi:hypothetical protein PHAVU_011G095200 [Phaseolus vulgaris]|uniref:Uncharacterized protein n=1 Tax=Phaseolus vulgaris TaxID=3885 RepID=V7AFV9_PHAVU|nr:hypothetical protein PHAVU_011G095200g [Phaseolus vulgaris]ESW04444.1 hypothetical protein PHAVU_011G095200g [Phaseolus vulgaris]
MEHIWKHVKLFYLLMLLHHLLLPVNSEQQINSSNIASVNRRGGGGGHGSGHASSMGIHGGSNGEHGNLPHPEDGRTVPLYGAAAAGSALDHRNNNHHHGESNATLTYVCFYHCLFFSLFSAAMGIFLCT